MSETTNPTNSSDKNDKNNNSMLLIIVIILLVSLGFIWMNKKKQTPQSLQLENRQQNQPAEQVEDQNQPADNQAQPATDSTQQKNDSLINNQESNSMDKTNMPKPEMVIDQSKNYYAVLKTNQGDIKVKFYTQDTPQTVNNFVYLAQNQFYDGLIFHRVIKDFMIQGGDPLGSGMGGPGYKFADEKSSNKLVKGSLAMTNSGPNTNGSQFFIVTADATPWLDGKHTNFGEVVEGMNVVEKIEQTQTGAQDKPVEEMKIEKVEIIEE